MNETQEMPQDEEYEPTAPETDFDLDDEYKEDPLAPQGLYFGLVKNVKYEGNNNAVAWEVVASGNDGAMMLDGSTTIDGVSFTYRNWLPKKGDERLRTASGKNTKRQAKINMLKQFQDAMEVDMNTVGSIMSAIENAEWIGLPVQMNIGIDTYEGRTRNVIKNMSKTDHDVPPPPEATSIPDDDVSF